MGLLFTLIKIYLLIAFLYFLVLLLGANQQGIGSGAVLSTLATQALLWPKDLIAYLGVKRA